MSRVGASRTARRDILPRMGLLTRRHRGASAVVLAVACAAPALVGTAHADAALTVRGSVEQVQVTGAQPNARITLIDRRGKRVEGRRANRLGGAVFREITPGSGYAVRTAAGKRSKRVRVLSQRSAPPSTKVYDQKIPSDGYGYITMRDGTKLAAAVRLPAGRKAPYPTLIEYSGYGYANPKGGESSIADIAQLLGYAVVDVNMRGTGCSGGAFDYFEPLQGLDGYDVIETVARQPWVMHGKVGMMGISYGGISQLFTAATRPPSLAAITPLSVIDSTQTTLYPGGILNTGFALSWAKDRVEGARVATATTGQRWAHDQIRKGDKVCAANQALHPEAVDLLAKTRRNRFYVPSVADPLAPNTFVQKIDVPTYLACQFTDEQTGGHCPTLASRFTGTDKKWFTFTNGTHIDSLDPATFTRWYDFMELYVARRKPDLSGLRALAPAVFQAAMGVKGVTLPDDPIQAAPTYEAAKTAFEALPQVRVLFENGAGSTTPGNPVPGFEGTFARFPAPGTRAVEWGMTPGKFRWSRTSRPVNSFSGNTASENLWTASPTYKWTAPDAGDAYTWTSAPMTSATTVLGAGAVEAVVQSSTPDVDLQATISEVRPDGKEVFVQNGWVRASMRKLDARKSTRLAPVLSLRRADAEPMPRGRATRVTIPLYYQGHAYRPGSRIRVTIGPPRGDQPVWAFSEVVPRTGTSDISVSAGSKLVLPVVPGVQVPATLPPCPGLRGQPCRTAAAG